VEETPGSGERLRDAMTKQRGALRAGSLWSRAQNEAQIESIQQYYVNKFGGNFQSVQSNPSVKFAGQPGTPEHQKWLAENGQKESSARVVDQRKISRGSSSLTPSEKEPEKNSACAPQRNKFKNAPCPEGWQSLGEQEFTIVQSSRVRAESLKLQKFWAQYGETLKGHWNAISRSQKKRIIAEEISSYFRSNDHSIESARKGLLREGNLVQEVRTFFPFPLGSGSKVAADCFLGDFDFDALVDGGAKGLSLIEIFEERAKGNCVAKDMVHVSRLLEKGLLPKLQQKPSGSFLCDYCYPFHEDKSLRHIVYVGTREGVSQLAESKSRNATNITTKDTSSWNSSGGRFMEADWVVELGQYVSLSAPLLDMVTVYSSSGAGHGGLADELQSLVDDGAASHATAYIYAALKQNYVLEVLRAIALSWTPDVVPDFMNQKHAYKSGSMCFRCAAMTNKMGGPLLCCSICNLIFYCSKECQKADWKRHKAFSCIPKELFGKK
jgi:hypothetical protein